MKTAVRYFSRSGNTKKIADAIAKEAGTAAETVYIPLEEPIDVLFVGGALYAGNIDSHLKSFLKDLDSSQAKTVAVFSNAAGKNNILHVVKELLADKGIRVLDEMFSCRGQFLLAHRGRPNDSDCAEAALFARETLDSLEGKLS